ncbi:phage N-6-adenine-methyltransferase [Desulfitobacterium hafniense]|uniref:phage N-6-adenine-methyltransferase n=1 Tax=Desulfitobacterium hafniense TaxID=49338 RepID=UPI001FA7868D|nr:phage N-6-adenine-methyltransferase [Desulfitobacterium hafniense]
MWETPQDFFNALDRIYRFTVDVCATAENAKCQRYFTPEMDGLSQEWSGVCWMNPPYGRQIADWVKKAYEESRKGSCTVVCFVAGQDRHTVVP